MECASRASRSNRRLVAVIVAMVLVWAAALAFRWELRAQWWAYRLAHTASPELQDYYAVRLASIGNTSLAVIPRLLANPNEDVRLAAIDVLRFCNTPRARALLVDVLRQESDDVAERAALVLALRKDGREAIPVLAGRLRGAAAVARHAAVALERIGGPEAERTLVEAMPDAKEADLRAQLADSLGMLGSRAAEGALHVWLEDNRPVVVLPASMCAARRALIAMQGELAGKGVDAAGALAERGQTVAGIVRRSLVLIEQDGAQASRPASMPSP
jgi:HEAT repeat protein